jgi:hypothetical protein
MSGKIKKIRADGMAVVAHQHDGTLALRNLAFSMVLFVCYIIWKTTDRDTIHVREERERHALGRAWRGAPIQTATATVSISAVFLRILPTRSPPPPPHLRPTGTDIFILETEI